MKNGLKIGVIVVLAALVGAGIVAGVAFADGGSKSSGVPAPSTQPAPSVSGAPSVAVAAGTQEALDALLTCAIDAGLDDVVAQALQGEPSLGAVAKAITAVGACEDEARALLDAVKEDVGEPADLLRGLATDAAACLDEQGVTMSRLAGALLGGDTKGLEAAAEACLPELPALIR